MRRSTRLLAVAVGVAVPLSPGTGAVTTVSGPSPFAGCRDGQPKVVPDAEVEPSLAVDPRDAHRIVAVYQQDRFRDGAARGIAAAASTDGGRSWRRSVLPVGPCATGRTGPPFRLSDPWVSIGPDGRVYALASSYAVTSRDGGRTWTPPVELAQASPGYLFDKGSLTADPARAGVAYAVWCGNGYKAVASEGGHAGFAPQNARQMRLLEALRALPGVTEVRAVEPDSADVYAGRGGPLIGPVVHCAQAAGPVRAVATGLPCKNCWTMAERAGDGRDQHLSAGARC